MADEIRFVEGGTVTTPKDFHAGSTYAGIKTYSAEKLDLGLLVSDRPASVAGVYTTSAIKSPSVRLTQERVSNKKVRALLVNSGIANACVGEQGYNDALEVTAHTAQRLGVKAEEVLIASTGIIGVELPVSLINAAVDRMELSSDGGHGLARAILTTDPGPKEAAVSFERGRKTITIAGIAKGSGMIHPNMATVLCFVTTDAQIGGEFLHRALKRAVDSSFNMLSIDGDTSTNDMVLAFSNGAAQPVVIEEGSPQGNLFERGLQMVCSRLVKQLARDGEGATKLIEVTVEGAASPASARMAARTVISSSLVKTAIHGADPNWGRIIAALARSGAEVEENKIGLFVADVCLMEAGRPIPYHKDAVVALMQEQEVSLRIQLNLGKSNATAWGCDLSEEYVTFNSSYTT